MKSFTHAQFLVTPWTVAHQDPMSMGFSKPECWSGFISFSRGSSSSRDRCFTIWDTKEVLKTTIWPNNSTTEHIPSGKLNFLKTKIMASSPITSWHIEGAKVEPVTDFIFLGSKIIVNHDHWHGIKRYLLLVRKAMTDVDSILKPKTSFWWQKFG